MKKRNDLISVIVPCYNAENYLRECIESILKQTYDNFELICVNDGSTDSTLDILNEYAKKNKNMIVLSKENEGGKNVVKKGLTVAKGKYVCEIDNDDFVSEYYLEKLHDCIVKNDADIAVCGFQRIDFETKKVYSNEMNKYNQTFIVDEDPGILLEVNTSMWNKMYKKEVFASTLDYKLDALAMGDMVTMIYIYSKVNKIAIISDILYYYQVRKNSNVTDIPKKKLDTVYDNLIRIRRDFYEKTNRLEFFDTYAFLHLGVSIVYRLYVAKKDFKLLFNNNYNILCNKFPLWKNSRYLKINYVLKNKKRNLKLFICKIFYKIHLFRLFIATYSFAINTLKIDIKW